MLALAGAWAGTGILSSVVGGLAQYQQGQFAKEVASRQSEALESQAQQVQQQAGAEIARQDYQATHIISSMRAATAASGITEEGSPATILAESVDEAQLNDMYTKYAANIQSSNLRYQGVIGKSVAEEQADAATIGAITSGITGSVTSGIEAYSLKTKTDPYSLAFSNQLNLSRFGGTT